MSNISFKSNIEPEFYLDYIKELNKDINIININEYNYKINKNDSDNDSDNDSLPSLIEIEDNNKEKDQIDYYKNNFINDYISNNHLDYKFKNNTNWKEIEEYLKKTINLHSDRCNNDNCIYSRKSCNNFFDKNDCNKKYIIFNKNDIKINFKKSIISI